MGNDAIHLAIADNDEIVLKGLAAIVSQQLPQVRVGWVAHSGHEAIERALDPLNHAGILLLDMSAWRTCRAPRRAGGYVQGTARCRFWR